MRNYLLGGVVVASAFGLMILSAPASAQGTCGIGHSCGAFGAAGPARSPYQHHGYGRGYGIGAGAAALAAGVIIGGAMEQNQGYYPAESYPVYSDQGPMYDDAGPQVVDDSASTAYCQQTFRSYDPASGTYLGYDGLRHSCP
jgi:hypothetical protein